MYNNSRPSSRSGDRSRSNPRSNSSFNSFARRNNSSRRPSRNSNVDYSKYIKKAVFTQEVDYIPTHVFNDFNIEQEIKDAIAKKGFTKPTPIQDQTIPLILEGKDVLGLANTGTGKTGAFLIPLIDSVLKNRKNGKNVQTLILAPTRELAQQIEQELRSLTDYMRIFSTCCVGGTDIRRQLQQLSKPNQFVIATPGRLMDLIDRRAVKCQDFDYLVLDEVDRMLDMGFVDDIRNIIESLPKDRQSLFFSATLDKTIEKLVDEFLNNPVRISVKTGNTSDNVDQDIVKIESSQSKVDVLHDLLIKEDFKKVLIFGRTKHGVEDLAVELIQRGISAEAIHGDKTQGKRQRALEKFKLGRAQVLVATDVAARGLDINNVSHVINFDLPENYEDYVHRIGRTGRGGKSGKALTFVS